MKMSLQIRKDGKVLYEGCHQIDDARTFGHACAQAWSALREQEIAKSTSIGALYESIDDDLLHNLSGAEIVLHKAP